MSHRHELGLMSPVTAMEAFLEPDRPWIESTVGCRRSEALTLELNFPFGEIVASELLAGVPLNPQSLAASGACRSLVERWALPPGRSPRLELHTARNRAARITDRQLAWDVQWKETPVAVWLKGIENAIVSVNIPYVSFIEKGAISWRQWVIVNRKDAAACLKILRPIERRRCVTVIGGPDIALPERGYDWDSVLLEPPSDVLIRMDFETFWKSEDWFARNNLPYRRSYLLYGPPGNGKTSVARVMACHPLVTAFSIDFSAEFLPNSALFDLFREAEENAPSVIVLEELDRYFCTDSQEEHRANLALPRLLNCLDGLATQNGIVVVATANNQAALDRAILKRPGRFDRVVALPLPSLETRRAFVRRLTNGTFDEEALDAATRDSDRLSFAQVREAYVLAGQRSFMGNRVVNPEELLAALQTVRGEARAVGHRSDGRLVGFAADSVISRAAGTPN